MPEFELIPIEEAKEATKIANWLDKKFGEEEDIIPYYGDCNCDDACKELATQLHPILEKIMVCEDCFAGLEAELNDDGCVHYHAGTVIYEKNIGTTDEDEPIFKVYVENNNGKDHD